MTFAELDRAGERLAGAIEAAGAGRGAVVALLLERSPAAAVGVLAAWKAGAAYVPVDPAAPPSYRAAVIRDSGAAVVVGDGSTLALAPGGLPALTVDDALAAGDPPDRTDAPLGPEAPAWVLFTSGSTGRPKGVVGPHRASLNRCAWMWDTSPFARGEVAVQNTAMTVVDSVWELWGALAAGVPVVLPAPAAAQDPVALAGVLADHRVTRICLVPGLLRALLEAVPALGERVPDLRLWVTSGSTLDRALVDRFYAAMPDGVLLNQYGLTESCADVTCFDTRTLRGVPGGDARVPIGRPITGADAYVLDDALCEVAPGAPGELCLAGTPLALGYANAPELTAEHFVPNPFGGGRLYRTGDLVRRRGDGVLEHLGRIDRQVKIRGFRIEPEGVEAVLAAHPGVGAAAVMAATHTGEARLAAYVTPKDARRPPSSAQLRAHVGAALPSHMVPSTFTVLAALPRTASGKTDYGALPAPRERTVGDAPVPPRDDRERELAELWRELLAVDAVGVEDDFFELGGDSLLVTRMLAAAAAAGHGRVATRDFVRRPTVAALAALASAAEQAPPAPAPAVPPGATVPVTPMQESILLHERLADAPGLYNIALAFRVRGELDLRALRRALDAVVAAHAALRASYEGPPGAMLQRFAQPLPCPLESSSLDAGASLAELLAAEAAAPFDLARPPLLRARVVALGGDENVLALTVHHVACDGRSLAILLDDLAAAYAAARAGRPIELRGSVPAPAPAAAAGAADPAVAAAEELPPLDLPTDRPRPPRASARGASFDFVIDPALSARLVERSRALGATPFAMTFAALAVVLGRHAGLDRFGVAVPIAGRATADDEAALGCFMRTVTLEADLTGDPDAAELLARVRDELWRAEAAPPAAAGEARPPQVMLAYDDAHAERFALDGARVAPVPVPAGTAKFDLTLLLDRGADRWHARFEYGSALFEPATVEALAAHFRVALEALCGEGTPRRLSELSILTAQERELVVETWNATARPFPEDRCLHERIAEEIARRPDALVALGDDRRTHAAVDAEADRLARALRARGAGARDVVGVRMERSVDLLVALLAVMKAGCAYLPLDSELPEARLREYVTDAAARLVVSDAPAPDGLPAVTFADLAREAAEHPAEPLARAAAPEDPAYVIFTSGSSGHPKGTVVSHRSIVSHLTWMQDTFRLDESDCVLLKTSIGFDVSTWELFWPFLAGARLELAAPGGHRDPRYLARTIVDAGVTTVHFVPSVLDLFIQEPAAARCTSLRRILAIGEALPADVVRRAARTLPAQVHNLYGPTEATVAVTWWPCPRDGDVPHAVPIGRPIANCETFVLDRHGGPAPIGVPGELVLGGVQVAEGYVGRPELTRERFVPHPFRDGERVYRTGDLVRWQRDGELEFLGRLDRQVKVGGVRVEPGEVEVVLRDHPGVADAVVVPDEDGAAARALVAYVVARRGAAPDPAELRAHAALRLPQAMVPARVALIPVVPRLASGKVDWRTLRSLEAAPPLGSAPPRPATPADVATADGRREIARAVWQEMLGTEVDDTTNFAAAGGDSFAAIKLILEVNRRIGSALPTYVLMRAATFGDFAAAVERALASPEAAEEHWPEAGDGRGTAGERGSLVSPLQERWFALADRFGHVEMFAEVHGPLRPATFREAVRALCRRHAVLRSVYEPGRPPLQRIVEGWQPDPRVTDLRGLPEDEARAGVAEAVARSMRPFDITREVPFEMELLTLAEDRCFLVGRMHHIATDGWSTSIRLEDFERVYAELEAGRDPADLPPAPQYETFARAQRAYLEGPRIREGRAYWQQVFAGSRGPAPVARTAGPQPPGRHPDQGRFVNVTIEPERAAVLRRYARERRSTLFTLLTTGFAVAVREATGDADVVFGTSSAGRDLPGTEQMLGVFVNPLPLRIDLRGLRGVDDLHAAVHRALLGWSRHQDYLLVDLVRHVEPFVGADLNGTFNSHIVFQNFPKATPRGPRSYEVIDFQDASRDRPFGLESPQGRIMREFDLVAFDRRDGSLSLNFGYKPALFSEDQVRGWVEAYTGVFGEILRREGAA